MSTIPVRLRPAYHADPWVVRGKPSSKQFPKTTPATMASKPRRLSRNTAATNAIRFDTRTTGLPLEKRTEKKRTNATVAAHALRNKTRKRHRTNRSKKEKRSADIRVFEVLAIIVR